MTALQSLQKQLQMVWPAHRPPPPIPTSQGYLLRTYRAGDEATVCSLLDRAGFPGWDADRLSRWLAKVVPDGWYLMEHEESQAIVATAMACDNPIDLRPHGGELAWVAADPMHRNRGLGTAVCAAVTRRLLASGYADIYLKTDDWRLPAIKIYLKLGYRPSLFAPGMDGRWRAVCQQLDCPFQPAS